MHQSVNEQQAGTIPPVTQILYNEEAVDLYKNLLRNRLIGSYFRIFSTNSGAIRSQIYENLPSNSQFLATIRKGRQPPRVV